MTERYGSDAGDEGQRPSGRGAVAERLARQPSDAREIDLTDEAAAREATDDQSDRESSGAFEPAAPTADPPAGDTRPGSSNIFDVDERDKQEEDAQPTGYEPGADAEATQAEDAAEAAPAEDAAEATPAEDAAEAAPAEDAAEETPAEGTAEEAADITPTPVPVAEPAADAPAPHGLPEPATATDTPAANDTTEAPVGSLVGSLDAGELRNRFLDIQAGFVDEPRQAVEEAGRFVDDLIRQVADAIQQQRGQLAGATPEGSTEDLRLALRAHRQFVDRLLDLAG